MCLRTCAGCANGARYRTVDIYLLNRCYAPHPHPLRLCLNGLSVMLRPRARCDLKVSQLHSPLPTSYAWTIQPAIYTFMCFAASNA